MHKFSPIIPSSKHTPFNQYWEHEFRDRMMEALKDEAIAQIQKILVSGIFKNSDGKSLSESVNGYISGDDIIFYSEKAHFTYMNEGVKPHTMWYLLNKTVSFSPGKGTGPIIRRVSLKAIMSGKWRHPGITGKHYIEEGYQKAMGMMDKLAEKVTNDMKGEASVQRRAA